MAPSTTCRFSSAALGLPGRLTINVRPRMPASALDSLQLRHDGDRARPFVTHDRSTVPFDGIVTGTARVTLRVRSRPEP
jgi:hypothetical protein